MKATQGVKMSYRLQEVLQENSKTALRGFRIDQDNIVALSGFIYSLIRNNRSQRRGLLGSVLTMFDDASVSVHLLDKTCMQEKKQFGAAQIVILIVKTVLYLWWSQL